MRLLPFILSLLLAFSAEAQVQSILLGYGAPAPGCAGPGCDETPPEEPVFAMPSSPTPTVTYEQLGQRLEYRDDPKGFNRTPTGLYYAATTQGERLWIGQGATGYTYGHYFLAAEPDGPKYVMLDGTLGDLPPLGDSPPPDRFPNCHEGTNMGATTSLPGGGSATYMLIMDGVGCANYSYRFVEDGEGNQSLDTLKLNGIEWANGAKHHPLDATESGMVALHMHSGHGGQDVSFPNIMVTFDGSDDFLVPTKLHTAGSRLVFAMGAVGDSIWIVGNETPALNILRPVEGGGAETERIVNNLGQFWGDLADVSNGFGPTPRYVGPAAGEPGFVLYSTATSRLTYHTGTAAGANGTGGVIPVDSQSAIAYQRVHGETWRVTYPDLHVQRLAALSVGPTSATPTWVTEITLDAPDGWVRPQNWHAEITDIGSIWLIGETEVTFTPTGVTDRDIAVAYYRGGTSE